MYSMGFGLALDSTKNPKTLKSFVYVITDKKLHKWADATISGSSDPGFLYDPRSGAVDLTDITGITDGYPDGVLCFPSNCCGTSRAGYVTLGCVRQP